jgi:hypothetical protein
MSLAQAQGGDIGQSLLAAWQAVVQYIPTLIGALIILLIGFIVGKVLQIVIQKVLHKLGVDRRMEGTHGGNYIQRMSPGASVSRGVGRVVFWLVFLFALVAAIGALGITAVSTFMNQVLAYLPNVIAAIAIFVIAALVASAISGVAHRTMGDTPMGRISATVGPVLVMGIAVFMILTQLGIAPVIVQITYTALIGAFALGLALAFGLGGRTVAEEMLRSGYQRAKEEQAQAKHGPRDVEEARSEEARTGWTTTPAGSQTETPRTST